QVAGMHAALAVGATVVLLTEVDPARIAAALRGGGITVFCCVPQFFYLLLRRVRAQVDASPVMRRLFPAMLRWNTRARSVGLNPGKWVFHRIHAALGSQMRALIAGGAPFDVEAARTFHALGIDVLQAYGLTETAGAVVLGRPGEAIPGAAGRAIPR